MANRQGDIRAKSKSRKKAVVVGMAVMDTIFRVPGLPESEQSVQVDSFSLHPGGKGLVQAVAAARLGMQVELISPLGSDSFASDIEAYLDRENIGKSLLKLAKGKVGAGSLHDNTPVTGVIKLRTGKSIALGWKNDTDTTVRLSPADVRQAERSGAIKGADVVFITFEVPVETVIETINVASSGRPRPLIIVTPAPPYNGVPFGREVLGRIDYLVAQEWEVLQLLPPFETKPHELPTKEELALIIRRDGVGCVCIVDTTGSLIQGKGPTIKTASFVFNPRDTAGARDAFAVALAASVLESGHFDKNAARWATAAWAAAASTGSEGVPQGMPDFEGVEAVLASVRTEIPSQ